MDSVTDLIDAIRHHNISDVIHQGIINSSLNTTPVGAVRFPCRLGRLGIIGHCLSVSAVESPEQIVVLIANRAKCLHIGMGGAIYRGRKPIVERAHLSIHYHSRGRRREEKLLNEAMDAAQSFEPDRLQSGSASA